MLGKNTLRMELHAVNRTRDVAHGHDFAVGGESVGDEGVWQVFWEDGQGVVAHDVECRWQSGKERAACMRDRADLAVADFF